jgi:cytidylate kinase
VRVIASADLRAERVSERHQISLKKAAAQVKASDKNRRKFLKRFFKADWEDPCLYDLVINTNRLSTEQSARLIVQAVATLPDLEKTSPSS